MDRERKDRLAKNETLFREVNERVRDVAVPGGAGPDQIGFLCECSNPDCVEMIALSLDEYQDVRSSPVQFAVKPGHEIPAIERVVTDRQRFLLVEKLGHEQDIARETDPRG